MNLWGATPLLVAALLGGAQHGAKQLPPTAASIAGSSVVLSQVDSTQWQTTLLLNSPVGEKCPTRSEFALQTSARNSAFMPIERKGAPSRSRYCRRITLTFRGPRQIPVSAALVLRAPGQAISSIPASFSRPVSMVVYFAVPAGIGLAMLIVLLLCALIFVKVYDWTGAVLRPWRTRVGNVGWNGEFWRWTVMASGAWTVNDSWATNISTVTAFVTTFLAATGAASTIFPGIALDRFVFVNMLAAGLIAAVPLVFAILYARWTARFPGPTTDTTIAPHVVLPKGYEIPLRQDLKVTWRTGKYDLRILRSGTTIKLRRKTIAILADGSPVSFASAPDATLASGTVIAPTHGQRGDVAHVIRAHSPLGTNTQVRLARAAVLSESRSFRWAWIRGGQRATIAAGPPGAPEMPTIPADTEVRLPAGAVAAFEWPVTASESPADRTATLPSDTKVSLTQAGDAPDGAKIWIRGQCRITLTESAGAAAADADAADAGGGRRGWWRRRRNRPAAPGQKPAITVPAWAAVPVTAPAGATITLPGGAALGAIDYPDQWPVLAKDGATIQAPPGSIIDILAGSLITVPGGSDLLVGGETAMRITSPGNLTTVPASSVAPAPKPPPGPHAAPGRVARMLARRGHRGGQTDPGGKPDPADIPLPCPVYLTAPSGAKITVAGQADVALPAGLAMMAPRRKAYVLRYERHLTVPAPANTLSASMRLVIVAALLTVFGVGAQLGIAGVLAYFSDASTCGRWTTFGLLGVVAAFLLYYSTTAIRSLADPQPGSSMSAAPGTSFTL